MRLGLADRELAEVEDRRREHGVGAGAHAAQEMIERTDAARRDHGHGHAARHLARQLEIVALARAVAVHARQQDLSGAQARGLLGPGEGVTAGGRATAVREDLPAAVAGAPLGVDGDNDRLRAEAIGGARDHARIGQRRGVERDLVGAGFEQHAYVLDGTHAAADRQWHEDALGGGPHDVEPDRALLVRRGDVEEADLVGAGGVVGRGRFGRIAGVAQIDEAHALDDAPVLDVEAGDDAPRQHAASSAASIAASSVNAPS